MPRTLVRSFGGGEITPAASNRFDLAKHQTGAQQIENYWVLPSGPLENRPGFEFINHTKYPDQDARLFEFEFNTEQTYILEIGGGYLRIHTNGGTLLDGTSFAITNATQSVPGRLDAPGHTFTNGQWVFVTGVTGMTQLNFRYFIVTAAIAGVSFRLKDPLGNDVDTTIYDAYVAGGTAERVFEIAAPYAAADLFGIKFTQSNDVLSLAHPGYDFYELRRVSPTSWTLTAVTFSPTIGTPGAPTVVAVVGPNGNPNPITHFYRTTAVAAETLEEGNVSPIGSAAVDLAVAGNYISITPAAVAGAIRYNVYKLNNGIFSFIAQTEGGEVRDNNITPDASKNAPIGANPFVGAGNHPASVGYFEGRRWFGGTLSRQQNFWGTVSGTESNMNYSIPTQDDDAIYGRLNGAKANPIRHVVPLANLVFLTSGGEWKVVPPQNSVLTPDTAFPKMDAAEGASDLKPLLAGGSVVYGADASGRVRKMDYKWQSNGYFTDDLSILAPHLFDGFTLRDSAYQKAPVRVAWFARHDGRLLGVTFHPEHEVNAWHQHSTAGEFRSLACVKEGTEYPLYAIIRREINSQTVQYVERMHTRFVSDIKDSFFVDAGTTYEGPAEQNVEGRLRMNGLWHLVGQTVKVLVNGATHPDVVVDILGGIDLQDFAADFDGDVTIHAGLGYRPIVKSLGAAWETEALAQALMKNVGNVYLRVFNTSTAKAGPALDRLREFPARFNEPYGTPPSLKTGWQDIPIDPEWNFDGSVFVVQDDPLPITILGWVLDIASEGQ